MSLPFPTTPQNYDFAANWHLIVPHLTTPKMDTLLHKCWLLMREANACYARPKYDPTLSPASQLTCTTTWETCITTALDDAIIENDDPRIRHLKPPAEHTDDTEYLIKYEVQVQQVLGLDFKTTPTHIVHWSTTNNASHWFNRYIGVYLARLVCPDETWYVLTDTLHTTVVSRTTGRLFDLVAWGWDEERVGQTVLPCEIWIELDPSFGGVEVKERMTERAYEGQ